MQPQKRSRAPFGFRTRIICPSSDADHLFVDVDKESNASFRANEIAKKLWLSKRERHDDPARKGIFAKVLNTSLRTMGLCEKSEGSPRSIIAAIHSSDRNTELVKDDFLTESRDQNDSDDDQGVETRDIQPSVSVDGSSSESEASSPDISPQNLEEKLCMNEQTEPKPAFVTRLLIFLSLILCSIFKTCQRYSLLTVRSILQGKDRRSKPDDEHIEVNYDRKVGEGNEEKTDFSSQEATKGDSAHSLELLWKRMTSPPPIPFGTNHVEVAERSAENPFKNQKHTQNPARSLLKKASNQLMPEASERAPPDREVEKIEEKSSLSVKDPEEKNEIRPERSRVMKILKMKHLWSKKPLQALRKVLPSKGSVEDEFYFTANKSANETMIELGKILMATFKCEILRSDIGKLKCKLPIDDTKYALVSVLFDPCSNNENETRVVMRRSRNDPQIVEKKDLDEFFNHTWIEFLYLKA